MYLLISVRDGCTNFPRSVKCVYIPSRYSHLAKSFHCLGQFHSVWLYRGHNAGIPYSQLSYGDRMSVCRQTSNLKAQSAVIIIPSHNGPVIAPSTHFGRLVRPAWTAVGLIFPPVTIQGLLCSCSEHLATNRLWLQSVIVWERHNIFLKPNGHYMGRNAQLTSRCCILYIYSTNIRIEYFKHAA